MKTQNVTVDLVMSFNPCDKWTRARVEKYFGGRKSMTPLEISRVRGVQAQDLLWLLLRTEFMSDKDLRLLACAFAERALMRERKAGREPAKASWSAINIARRYAIGEATSEELKSAAWSALEAAAWSALESAAWSALEAAERSAERSAVKSAAWSAVEAAERSALSAELRWQLRQVRKALMGASAPDI